MVAHGRRLVLGIAAASTVLFLAVNNNWSRLIGQGSPSPACQDGTDNDGDYIIDYPDDPGCLTPSDTTETDPAPLESVAGGIATRIHRITYDGMHHADVTVMINNQSTATINNITTVITHDPQWTYLNTQDWCIKTNSTTITCTRSNTAGSGIGASFFFKIACVPGGRTAQFTAQTTNPPGQPLTQEVRIPACPLPACDDGVDNDGDGKIDFKNTYYNSGLPERSEQPDPGCADIKDNSETDPVSSVPVSSATASSTAFQTAMSCTSPISTPRSLPFTGTQPNNPMQSPPVYSDNASAIVAVRSVAAYPACNGPVVWAQGGNALSTMLPFVGNSGGDFVTYTYCGSVQLPITSNGSKKTLITFRDPVTGEQQLANGSTLRLSAGTSTFSVVGSTVTSYDPNNVPIETFNIQPLTTNAALNTSHVISFTKGIVKTVEITDHILNSTKFDDISFTALSCPQCDDDADNDGDGVTDFPADSGCTAANDNDERGSASSSLPPASAGSAASSIGGSVQPASSLTSAAPASCNVPGLGTGVQLVAADFNGDGRQDFVVTQGVSNNVALFINDTQGGYVVHQIPTGMGIATMATVSDVTGDGKKDVVLGSNSGLRLLESNGDGTFALPRDITPQNVSPRNKIVSGDFSGDGKSDLAFYGYDSVGRSYSIYLMTGKGGGLFDAPQSIGSSTWGNTDSGDFNRDGKPDIIYYGAYNSSSPGFIVLLGGSLPMREVRSLRGGGPYISKMFVKDMDGDGADDLYVSQNAPDAEIYKSDGNGRLFLNQQLPNAASIAVGFTDWDADGRTDAVVAGRGNGTSPDVQIFKGKPAGATELFETAPTVIPTVTKGMTEVATGDFNGDGRVEIAMVHGWNGFAYTSPSTIYPAGISFIHAVQSPGAQCVAATVPSSSSSRASSASSSTTGTTGACYQNLTAPTPAWHISAADFNRDGYSDFAATASGSVYTYISTGPGTYSARTIGVKILDGAFIVAGNFDNDNKPDIALADELGSNRTLRTFKGNGDGTFTAGPTTTSTIGIQGRLRSADFNKDGIDDVLLTSYRYTAVLLGQASGQFAAPVVIPDQNVSGTYSFHAIGDFTGDGATDIAYLVNNVGQAGIIVMRNDGTGQFRAEDGVFSRRTGTDLNPNLFGLFPGDLNGDGIDDIFLASNAVNYAKGEMYLGSRTGTMTLRTTTDYPGNHTIIADANNDGKQDIILIGSYSGGPGDIYVRLGNGDGTFAPSFQTIPYGMGSSLVIDGYPNVLAGDFDNDGKTDLAAVHPNGANGTPGIVSNVYRSGVSLLIPSAAIASILQCEAPPPLPSSSSSNSSSSSASSVASSLAATVDVKINGQDGVIVVASGSTVTVSWTTQNAEQCDTGTSIAPWGPAVAKPSSGSEQVVITKDVTLGLQCSETGNPSRTISDSTSGVVISQCSDKKDNDGDGSTDMADAGCSDPADNNEEIACSDGKDNDQDGVWDMADPGCASPTDDNENDETCVEPTMLLYNLQPIPFPDTGNPATLTELRAAGYNVTYHTRLSLGRLETNFLKQFSTVWLMDGCGNAQDVLRTDELSALETFFKASKGNLILSPGDVERHGIAKAGECVSRINQVAGHLGFAYASAAVAPQRTCQDVQGNSPLLNGVAQMQRSASYDLAPAQGSLWSNVAPASAISFTDGKPVAAFTEGGASHGAALLLQSYVPLKSSCNAGQAYRNLFGVLDDARLGCPCAQASQGESSGFYAWFKNLLSSLLPSRFVAQTRPAPTSCTKTQCNDGLDNDGDGKTDMQDPGCLTPQDDTEQDDVTPIGGGICVIVAAGSKNVTPTTMVANCPPGFLPTGGGWKGYGVNDNSNDISRPVDGGWECDRSDGEDAKCMAVCCNALAVDTTTVVTTGPLKDHLTAQCPAGYTMTGGGFSDTTAGKDEERLGPEQESGWHCFDDGSASGDSTCVAVCARAKGSQEPLNCVTESFLGPHTPPARARCGPGTVVTGGGFIDNSSGNDDEDANAPTETGWYCAEDYGDSPPANGMCFARCCEMPEPEPATVTAAVTGPALVQPGATATYTITLKNVSTVPATDAFIRNHLPLPNASLVSVPAGCSDKGWQNGIFAVECHHALLAPDASVSFQLSYVVPQTAPCTFIDSVYADADNAFPSPTESMTTATPCGSSASSSSVILTSSSSSSLPPPPSSGSSASNLCTYNGCLSGGTEFCSQGGELCQSAPLSPCFRCGNPGSGGSSAGTQQCTFNGCDRGGSGYCGLRGQGCQASQESPCFTCGGSLPSSSRSSARNSSSSRSIEPACTFNGCDRGGSAFCSAGGELCQSSPQSPCFRCGATLSAASSSSAQQCAFDGCLRGGTSFCRLQGLGCSASLLSPCFSCGGAASSVSSDEPPSSEGSFCTEDRECLTGLCRGSICTGCTQANDCADGFFCLDNACVDASALAFSAPDSPEARCGNGVLDQEEECEDGNTQDGDDCSAECLFESGRCGDGIVQRALGEQCDGSAQTPEGAICTPRCTLILRNCGNGLPDPGEECDEGNRNSDGSGASCRRNCSVARCGDAVMDPGERCDDGNRLNGDGCDRACAIESGAVGQTLAQTAESFEQEEPSFPLAMLWPSTRNAAAGNDPIVGSATTAALPFFVTPAHPPVGETGPATVAVMAAGAAAGIGWVRKKKRP